MLPSQIELSTLGVLNWPVCSRCVLVGFWCTLSVIRLLIGEIHSRWTRTFFGIVGVAIPGWAWELQGEHGTPLLL